VVVWAAGSLMVSDDQRIRNGRIMPNRRGCGLYLQPAVKKDMKQSFARSGLSRVPGLGAWVSLATPDLEPESNDGI
jgi:hypothetical protein